MLIKTVTDKKIEGVKLYNSYCREEGAENFSEFELNLVEMEYDAAFAEMLKDEIEKYYMHTVFTYDYESSSDAGDGRDDYYTEEGDEKIDIDMCIVKDGRLFGVMCESFEIQRFLLLDCPETIISHPGNYGGRNYHFYRNKCFKLLKK
ncbi:MAG: hypothetical protein Q4G23_11135 [Clostridia bacterium]|nr:hypothetical protein [Clostridia bacterium]